MIYILILTKPSLINNYVVLLISNIIGLAATPHKTPTIRPPASHHENYPS